MAGGGRRTNLALLALLPLAVGTGVVAYALGAPSGRAVVIGHGLAGLAVLLLSPWKSVIVRRGLRRGNRGRSASLLLAALVVVTVGSGIAHAWGVRELPLVITAMHLHVGAALASLPLAVWHVLARPVRPRRSDASRRALLRAGALGVAAAGAWVAGEGAQRIVGTRGVDRRFTGSHEVGTDEPSAMPVIQWLTDDVQRLDPAAWRLVVRGSDGRERALDLPAVRVGEDVVRATIDCTSGWYAAQDWRAVRLDRLLDPTGAGGRAAGMAVGGASSILVTSATGYARRFPLRDVERLWLATGYAGRDLAEAHGAPARLVAPGRRGFWWVKWVVDVRLDDTPWWRQPPFPLQ